MQQDFLLATASTGHWTLQWLTMPWRENEWVWNAVAAVGMFMFFTRFLVQWLYSEHKKESKVPTIFWWQSLLGALLMLLYALRQRDLWFTLGYVFTFIPYSRNLVLMYRKRRAERLAAPGFPVLPSDQ